MPGVPLPPPAERKAAFLEAYRVVGVISQACEATGVGRRTHYEWMRTDPDYAEQFAETHEAVVDEAEAELKRRGIHGDAKPVFFKGVQCGTVQEKSDACLIFYLKGRRGDVFRDRGEISGPGGGPIPHEVSVDLTKLPTEQLRQMRQWMLEAGQRQGEPAAGAAPALPDIAAIPLHNIGTGTGTGGGNE
jgi:hypothetical protein